MSLIVSDSGGGDFEKAPIGNHIARCYAVIDMGIQETNYGLKPKVKIAFELCNEHMSDGKPFGISKNYTTSLNEKANLRSDLQSWRGRAFTEQELKGFDVFTIVGHPCMLNVIHAESGGNTYANIASISPIPKGMHVPPLANDMIKFSLSEYDEAEFQKIPEYWREKINTKGQEAPANSSYSQHPESNFDDDIPF